MKPRLTLWPTVMVIDNMTRKMPHVHTSISYYKPTRQQITKQSSKTITQTLNNTHTDTMTTSNTYQSQKQKYHVYTHPFQIISPQTNQPQNQSQKQPREHQIKPRLTLSPAAMRTNYKKWKYHMSIHSFHTINAPIHQTQTQFKS